MESVNLDMDDIYEDGENEGQDFAGVPDLEEDLEPMMGGLNDQDNDEAQGDGDGQQITDVDPDLLEKLKSMRGASKNTVKRVMPKLDFNRLTGERGIPILPKVFEKVHLKGKRHELEDLKVIIRTLEHWGHRLFPKMPFSEVLDRCEKLGAKKPVQTCVKRIRLDMEVLQEFVREGQDEEDAVFGGTHEEEDNVQRAGDDEDNVTRRGEEHFETEIDEGEIEDLLREQAEYEKENSQSQPGNNSQFQETPANTPGPDKNTTISDEAKARIEKNKRLAMERRAAKLKGNTSVTDDGNRSTKTTVAQDHLENTVSSQSTERDMEVTEVPKSIDDFEKSKEHCGNESRDDTTSSKDGFEHFPKLLVTEQDTYQTELSAKNTEDSEIDDLKQKARAKNTEDSEIDDLKQKARAEMKTQEIESSADSHMNSKDGYEVEVSGEKLDNNATNIKNSSDADLEKQLAKASEKTKEIESLVDNEQAFERTSVVT